MRLHLCAVLSGIGLALMVCGGPPTAGSFETTLGVDRPAEFDPPEVIVVGSEHGSRLYPHYADFDGDGKIDQVVGVGNRLRVYRNGGTRARPEYAAPAWFDETETSARIPDG